MKLFVLMACALVAGATARLPAADQPQWGQRWSRNMISDERDLADSFDPKSGRNIKWIAPLGTESYSTPIVAGGRVYIGTNNGEPRDPKHVGDRGVMLCLDETNGRLLWQLVVPKREEDPYHDWPRTGISSPVTVEGDRVYLVDNRGGVLCLDARGLANGNDGPFMEEAAYLTPRSTNPVSKASSPSPIAQLFPTIPLGTLDADIVWLFDLTKGAGIWSHDGAHTSILIDGDYLYLNTGTGVDNTHRKIRTPNAPSLVVLDKRTGQLLARDDEHIAPNIFHCTWSSPSLGEVKGRKLIFFAGGNGVVYAFEPLGNRPAEEAGQAGFAKKRPWTTTNAVATLKKVWQFDIDPNGPKENVHRFTTNRREGPSNIYGFPVFYRNRVYVAGGGDLFWGKNEAWLKCIDATSTGDITVPGAVWSYPLEKHVLSTPALADGLAFIADCGRRFHCLDADSGRPLWTHEIKGEVWASPMVADGKVYLGTRSGAFYVFAASREKKVLTEVELGKPISATTTVANGVLYVATMSQLYAVRKSAE